jgi:hypothetical protein
MAVTFTQRAADRISRAIKWVEQQIRTQGNTEGTVTPRSVEPTYVLTTSGTATSGFYPGKVVLYSAADAAWQDYSTCKILPANGETLTNNTRYAARYTGRNSGGDGVFTVLQGGGGGLSTVDEVDGSPTYSAITYLSFDQADGFSISNPSTGKVRIDISPASTTQTGVVNTTSQTFGGDKVFNNTVTVNQSLTGESTGTIKGSLYAWSDLYVNSTILIGPPGNQGASPYIRLTSELTSGLLRLSQASGGNGAGLKWTGNNLDFGILPTSGANFPTTGMNYNTSTLQSAFYCDSTYGVYGTLKTGAVSRGGIIISLGNTSTQSSSWMGF